ncbi:MAG: DUF3857 domain-containing protein, partial [Zoogloea sp.]|nr:DUF3857 domain-containing protein [Zoogloea sp.]
MSSSFCRLRPLLFAAALVFQCQAHAQQAGEQAAPSVREIQVAAGAFTRGDPVPAWVRPVEIPATSRRNPVVIRLADTQFRLGEPNSVFINRAVQVNDNSALARIGQYTLEFVPQYQKLRLHKVLILRDGKTTDHTRSVDVRFLQRETGLERGIYSGSVTASLLLSDVRVGDTLHIAYSLEGTNPVFGDMRSDAASWDQNDPVELRNVVLSYPRSRNINWRMEGDFRKQRVSPETSEDAGYRVLRWQERGIDGLDFEPYTPDSYLAYRLLEFSEYPDWNSVARWANTLFPPAGPLSPELRGVVEKLRALPTADARASAALVSLWYLTHSSSAWAARSTGRLWPRCPWRSE